MNRQLVSVFSVFTLYASASAFALACAAPADEAAGSGAGAGSVQKSGDWTLRCISGSHKGQKTVQAQEPTHKQKVDFCKDGVAQASEKATDADGHTLWTIRCDVDQVNGKAKKVTQTHEPTDSEL